MIWIIVCFIWYMLGLWGSIFYWRKEKDITVIDFIPILVLSIIGPIVWLLGWMCDNDDKVLIKKKRS